MKTRRIKVENSGPDDAFICILVYSLTYTKLKMSSLSESEKLFIRDFLKLMNDDAVQALASTVTRRMVKADTRRGIDDCFGLVMKLTRVQLSLQCRLGVLIFAYALLLSCL